MTDAPEPADPARGLQPRRLRIALVSETWPPEVNGVASTLAQMADRLAARGHAIHLARPRQCAGDSASAPCAAGGLLVRALPLPRYPGLRMGWPAPRRLAQAWRAWRPDIVHVATEGPLGWSARRAARALGLPVVSDFRTNFHDYSQHYGAGWLRGAIVHALRAFHNGTACTMVPTDTQRRALQALGFERLRVVGRGVDALRFSPVARDESLRRAWGAGARTRVVLAVGRLAPEKNLDLVVEAFEALRERAAKGHPDAATPPARLLLVGDGPDRARLQRRCPQAIFAGVQRGDALAAHVASADILLFASTTETYGNVVPEAMASGLAVVAYDRAAAGMLIRHGVDGLLAPEGDREGFVRLAASLGADPARAARLGGEARRTALRLDWDEVVDEVEREYRRAIALHGVAAWATSARSGGLGWGSGR